MMKPFLIILLFFPSIAAFCQETIKQEAILYIVDNVPIIDDPKDDDVPLQPTDIDILSVITNKAEIEKLGFKNIDKIIEIKTKAYSTRPDSLKHFATTKLLIRKGDTWYAKDSETPFSGRFIDYNLNGTKQGEGYLIKGKINGLRTTYYPNGNKSFFRNYTDGIANGYSEEYFQNGKLKQKGAFKNGTDNGLWQDFYSTGKIKRESTFINNKVQFSKQEEKFYNLLSKSVEALKTDDYKSAINKLDDAVKINSNYADIYFYRGTAKLENLDFDNAVIDFDKALELEPMYMEAVSNRAFARIRKYQFKDSRTLTKNSEVTILAAKDKVNIPKPELDKICSDLNLGYQLGDHKVMIVDALKTYCK